MTNTIILGNTGVVPLHKQRRPGPRTEAWAGWLFVLPFVLLFTVFIAVPMFLAAATSLTDMKARDLRNPLNAEFVGFDTFAKVFSDPAFLQSVGTTALFVVLCVPLSMGIGLFLAVLLDTGIRRLRAFFRAAVYVPVITNIVAVAVIFQYAFSLGGPINTALESFSFPAVNWLGESGTAVFTVVLMSVWRNVGMCMVLFLAGLQAVPGDVYEAAQTDGAGPVRRFWSITLPLLRPTTLLVSVLMTFFFINIFEEPYMLTGGGPLGSTRSLALWVYEQFGFGNVAASMAGSVVLLALVAIVAAIQFRLLRPKH
ncbi:sugar ABC transporter permease [Microbacterium sp. YMB-B2]|uniref:Sugar ABC transporter permease n=1 Tax=Microbacterium tenebrionis TaxID=2830665 RepID=A0A9X1LND8_9MICO|nr:sugar ABC transporter permease [Microbacterium tenebrionis]MCC2028870.1 sugar ABC transporter permease [Microbacterium tenebrionis]